MIIATAPGGSKPRVRRGQRFQKAKPVDIRTGYRVFWRYPPSREKAGTTPSPKEGVSFITRPVNGARMPGSVSNRAV